MECLIKVLYFDLCDKKKYYVYVSEISSVDDFAYCGCQMHKNNVTPCQFCSLNYLVSNCSILITNCL